MTTNDIRDAVRERYGHIAERGGAIGCCETSVGTGSGCGCSVGATETVDALGYTEEQRAAIPTGSDLGLGCGNPLAHAGVAKGETVLDLGSGAGIDVFLAARETGPGGRVIGVLGVLGRADRLVAQRLTRPVLAAAADIERTLR